MAIGRRDHWCICLDGLVGAEVVNGVVAKEARSGVGLQGKRREPAALTLLFGQVVMEHSRKTGAFHFEGRLAVCWSLQRFKEKNTAALPTPILSLNLVQRLGGVAS